MKNVHPIIKDIAKDHLYNVPFEYKGYIIDLDEESEEHQYLFYPANHNGPSHDWDYVGEQYMYCGNCKFRPTIGECITEIDQMPL